ncbi:MAG: hypothetical protein WCR05_07155 [Sphaerochaetaceae bacterium]
MKRSVRRPVKPVYTDVVGTLSKEFGVPAAKVEETLRGCGLNLAQDERGERMPLYREILSCRFGRFELYASGDAAVEALLDEQLRVFDEIYVDTAPIIQEDWFLKFLGDAIAVLRRRKKRLIILEKTMEELHGLKDNPEKDWDVRIRALIRPELIRSLARKGLVRIQDTGSRGIADDHLVSVFAAKRQRESLLLITQDRGLSERIVRIAAEPVVPVEVRERNGFFARIFGKRPAEQVVVDRKMMVCKFDESGALRRFYLCPDCGESFYDLPVEGNGMVLCRRCYQNRLAEEQAAAKRAQVEAKRVEERARRQELKAAEDARRELEKKEAEEARLAAERAAAKASAREIRTVEDAVKRNRRRYMRLVLSIIVSLAAFGLLGFLFVS